MIGGPGLTSVGDEDGEGDFLSPFFRMVVMLLVDFVVVTVVFPLSSSLFDCVSVIITVVVVLSSE